MKLHVRSAAPADLPRVHEVRHGTVENRLVNPARVTDEETAWYLNAARYDRLKAALPDATFVDDGRLIDLLRITNRMFAQEHEAELFYAHDKESYPRYLKAPRFYSYTRKFARLHESSPVNAPL